MDDVERIVLQHERGEAIGRVDFLPSDDRCLTMGGHGAIRVWSTTTGQLLHVLHGGALKQRTALLLEGDRLVALDVDGTLRAWDLRAPPGQLLAYPARITGAAVAGDRLVFCTNDAMLGSIDLRDRTLEALLPLPESAFVLRQVAVAPDERRLAVTSLHGPPKGHSAFVIDLVSGERAELPAADREGVWKLAWSADGTRLAVQDERHGLDVYALRDAGAADLELVASAPFSGEGVRGALAYSPDGRLLAARLGARRVGLLDPQTLEVLRELPCEGAILTVLAWSPDGSRLAGGFRDDAARIWSVADGRLLHELRGHERTVVGLAWSPDGGLLATGSMDTSLRLWDTEHGDELLRLSDERAAFRSLTFARDGECLVGETESGLWIWDSADAADHPPLRDPSPPGRDVQDLVERRAGG